MLMINDILEMSRLDAGRVKLSLEVVDIGDVVGIVRATVGAWRLRSILVHK